MVSFGGDKTPCMVLFWKTDSDFSSSTEIDEEHWLALQKTKGGQGSCMYWQWN